VSAGKLCQIGLHSVDNVNNASIRSILSFQINVYMLACTYRLTIVVAERLDANLIGCKLHSCIYYVS